MREESLTHTFQTRLKVDEETDALLSDYAFLMSKVERSLFSEMMKGTPATSCKTSFLKRFTITARQFNSVRVSLEGKIDSYKKVRVRHLQEIEEKIADLEKSLPRFKKERLHRKKQRLSSLKSKESRIKRDIKEGKIRLCFGSKKLFLKQFTGELSQDDWKKEWQERRNSGFFLLGSKDETAGNQSCSASLHEGAFTLRLRLPNALGRYLLINNIRFAYGEKTIQSALNGAQAISYRFVKDHKGWLLFASTTVQKPNKTSDPRLGAIGIDINNDHLALIEIDRFGNPIRKETISLSLYGKTTHQAKALIGDAAAHIVKRAQETKKPLIIETLDFSKKKLTLRKETPQRARRLSSFSYSKIVEMIGSRAYRNGIECFRVNPAFTSLIGRIKFAKRYGLSIHHAAALSIARRHFRFSEKLPSRSSVPDGKGGHISFSLPVRNGKKNEWSHLKVVFRKWQAALAGHFRAARRSGGSYSSPCDEISSKLGGATPPCESLAELFGSRI